VIATVAAACAAWLLIEGLGGVDLQAPAFSDGSSAQDIDLVGVLFISLTASLAGWLALGLIERYTARPRRWWVILAVGALFVSLGGPMSGPGIDNTNRAMLVLLHLIVAAVLIPLFYRTINNRAETT
jgi:apolipoprotein N-acyltransferase